MQAVVVLLSARLFSVSAYSQSSPRVISSLGRIEPAGGVIRLAGPSGIGSVIMEMKVKAGDRVEEAQQALVTQHSPTGIADLPADISEAALLQEFRGLATGFAAALTGWVEMREVASALADGMISSRAIYPH
jgi:hypothetical protein